MARPLLNHRLTMPPKVRTQSGVTMLEMMVVIAIIAILAAMAVPNLGSWMANGRLKDQARNIADAFMVARAEAIRTGSAHIVLLNGPNSPVAPNDDLGGNSLPPDPNVPGVNVPAVVLNDGPLAGIDCTINPLSNPSDIRHQVFAEAGVAWGVTLAGVNRAPNDNPLSPFNDGASFADQNGVEVSWVLFRPDGIPVTFDAGCNPGPVGSGAGAVYLSNGRRDYAVVLSPLGGVRVHAWDPSQVAWRN